MSVTCARLGPVVHGINAPMLAVMLTAAGLPLPSPGAHSEPPVLCVKGDDCPVPPTAESSAATTEGEVRKIDREQGKITLKHGEIRNLDMPSMTMVFRVADPKMLDAVNQGDQVRFTAEKLGGQFAVTGIETKQSNATACLFGPGYLTNS